MMGFRVYISRSMKVPDEKLKKLINYLKGENIDISYWKKGTEYNLEMFQNNNAYIFMLGDGFWSEQYLSCMTSGTLKELTWCLSNRKTIFIAYQSSDGKLAIYGANITPDLKIVGDITRMNTLFKIVECAKRAPMEWFTSPKQLEETNEEFFY